MARGRAGRVRVGPGLEAAGGGTCRAAARRAVVTLALVAAAACAPPPPEEPRAPGQERLSGAAIPSDAGEAPDPFAPSQEDRDAIVAVAERLFEGMARKNRRLLEGVMLPETRLAAVREDGSGPAEVFVSERESFVGRIQASTAHLVERMWDPRVRVSGDVATLWAPYDLYRDGVLSHCGVDAFQLVRTEEGWKVSMLTYNIQQPPACELHPDGPPGSGG